MGKILKRIFLSIFLTGVVVLNTHAFAMDDLEGSRKKNYFQRASEHIDIKKLLFYATPPVISLGLHRSSSLRVFTAVHGMTAMYYIALNYMILNDKKHPSQAITPKVALLAAISFTGGSLLNDFSGIHGAAAFTNKKLTLKQHLIRIASLHYKQKLLVGFSLALSLNNYLESKDEYR